MRIETDVRKMYSVGTMKGFVQFIGIRTDEKIAVFFCRELVVPLVSENHYHLHYLYILDDKKQ